MEKQAMSADQFPTPGPEYPFHQNADELVVTRGDEVIKTLSCERIPLDGQDRWNNGHIRGQVGKTTDGTLYAQLGGAYGSYWVVRECRNVMFSSTDQGRTWSRWHVDLPDDRIIAAFTVLADDTFLVGTVQPSDDCIGYYLSSDRGKTWELVSEVHADPFKTTSLDGNLLQLADGSILSPATFGVPAPEGEDFSLGLAVQYMLRSTDGGRTWSQRPDSELWRPLIEAKLFVGPVGADSRTPGPGGTFFGCFEVGIAQEAGGRIVAAERFSGAPWPWHKKYIEAWGGKEPDNIGRIYRQVMFSTSTDGGTTWATLRPFADADGKPVIVQQETNGQIVPLPDGRLVLIHQRRFGPMQIIARVSNDAGETWSADEYRLSAGFGYTGNTVLDDGTILTITGQTLASKNMEGSEHYNGAQAIRWQLPQA
jgi:hypothetical protein